MSAWQIIYRSLLHHWRINFAVALGVAAATAVLTGALLVGDSVRGSLLHLTLDRLGKIDYLLLTDRFFREELAMELAESESFVEFFSSATPSIIFPSGTVEHRSGTRATNRAAGVLVMGCDERFWQLGEEASRPARQPGIDEIVLNEPLADDLGIRKSDLDSEDGVVVTLRFPKDESLPADFSVGKKEGLVSSLPQLRVVDVVPAESLGRFSLHASQSMPRNAYVSIESLQRALDKRGKVNAILVAGNSNRIWQDDQFSSKASAALEEALKPAFDDYGFVIKRARLVFKNAQDDSEHKIFDYYSFSSERMILDEDAATAAEHAFAANHGQPVFTYLANNMGQANNPDDGIPWSMISAIDFTPNFRPISAISGEPIEQLADDEIVLNSWAVDDLDVKIGDRIVISYYDPETSYGREVERTAEFKLKDVVRITRPSKPFGRRLPAEFDKRPTLVNDPDLTPFVPGVTDQESIDDWDLPFDTSNIGTSDDDYWNYCRTTPKAFVSLSTGQRLWRSRFGQTTTYRISAVGIAAEELEQNFLAQTKRDGARFGFEFTPVKQFGVTGTTPFDGLFFGLSLFIVVAALLLVSLLFRLGIEQRASELGIELAIGWSRRLATKLQLAEGLVVAAIGGVAGIVVGVGYAWLMLAGLRTIWLGAIVTPFLQFHWSTQSLLIGYVCGVLTSLLTIVWSVRQARKVSVRQLMSGRTIEPSQVESGRVGRLKAVSLVLLIVAFLLTALATMLGGEAQAGAFVGGGVMLLTSLLLFIWNHLRSRGDQNVDSLKFDLPSLAARNAGRNPARSTITIGLVAFASFLLVAMSCFRLAPTDEGTGGFDLICQSNRPIFADLNSPQGRRALLDDQAEVLSDGAVLSFRLRPGDDASCNNLYQSVQPRVLGVSSSTIEYFDDPSVQHFAWAASAAKTDQERANPWRVLFSAEGDGDDAIPVVIDKNTAMYSLKLYWGIGEQFTRQYNGHTINFRVAGLLAGSVLQGNLLIAERDFVRLFPDIGGYRYFLVQSPLGKIDQVTMTLEGRLGDQGFDAVSAVGVLEQLFAVQNTYLSTFQSLGGLGLLLGTFGLATVQLRSVLERRKELALLRAAGFRRRRLGLMVMLENGVLLVGGMLTGVVAALLAVLPHAMFGNASVPVGGLVMMLAVILVVGLVTGILAVRAALRTPLLAALRGD